MRLFKSWLMVGLFSALAGAAVAQPFNLEPGYYAVTGVSANDVLNIRAEPDASAPIVGSFAPDAAPVEVLIEQDGWGYVSSGEGMGWASMAFLQPLEVSRMGQSAVPDGLTCGGTEPFWGASMSESGINFASMDSAEEVFSFIAAENFGGAGPLRNLLIGGNATRNVTAVISTEICSDGMSDRDYPRRIDLVFNGEGGPSGYAGCCSMPLN